MLLRRCKVSQGAAKRFLSRLGGPGEPMGAPNRRRVGKYDFTWSIFGWVFVRVRSKNEDGTLKVSRMLLDQVVKKKSFATKKKRAPTTVPLCQLHANTSRKWSVKNNFQQLEALCKNLPSSQRCQVAQKYRCKATADLHLHSLNASKCAGHSPSCLAANISRPLSLISNVPTKWKPKNSVLSYFWPFSSAVTSWLQNFHAYPESHGLHHSSESFTL